VVVEMCYLADTLTSYAALMNEEGWYQDPYGLHTDRWISDGRPTNLVRDDGVESYDAPPADTPIGALIEAAEKPPRPGDLNRADDAAAGDQSRNTAAAVLEHGIIGPDFSPR
jgi:hypothetical protein